MVTVNTTYTGDLSTTNTHIASKSVIKTDAPVDNQGLGRTFSPTDLLATSLTDCLLTTLAIASKKLNINIDGAVAETTKIMTSEPPRRIDTIKVVVEMPKDQTYSPEMREKIVKICKSCPVSLSLNQNVKQDINFVWE